MATDFAETLRKHWRNACAMKAQHGDGSHRCTSCSVFEDRVLTLMHLADACGIELEPKKCVLCGHESPIAWNIIGLRENHMLCVDSRACQDRLLKRYLEQLKDGAR